jgi:hypothetical protein
MKYRTLLLASLGLAHALLLPVHAQSQTEIGVQLIADLAVVNGQALACQELKTASRAKSLMLGHAPKTARFGNIYEEGTQQSYAKQINGATACPSETVLMAQLNALAKRLETSLPRSVPEAVPEAVPSNSTTNK